VRCASIASCTLAPPAEPLLQRRQRGVERVYTADRGLLLGRVEPALRERIEGPQGAVCVLAHGQAEAVEEGGERVTVASVDPRGARVDRRPRELQGVDPAADPVARFQDDDLDPGLSQRAGEREPGDPRADDQRAIGGA
jgi:hypothetical protein